MSNIDEISGAKVNFGGNRKHRRGSSGSGGKWRFKSQRTTRTWTPNLRKVKVIFNGILSIKKVTMKTYKKLRTGEAVKGHVLASA
jgi:ribosomal protein L28